MKTIKNALPLLAIIIAIVSCKNDDDFNAILVEGPAPTSVEAQIEIDNENPGLVTVSPNAVGAASFTIFFGDPNSNEALIGRNSSATNTYPEGEYLIRIIATAPNDKTTEITEAIVIDFTTEPEFEFDFDFENTTLEGAFDFGAPIEIVDNPFVEEANMSESVLRIDRGAGQFQGSGFGIPELDLTTPDRVVTIQFYSTIPASVSVDVKNGLNGARSANVAAEHTGSGWETLSFDYSNATKAFEADDPENFQPLPAEEVGIYTQIQLIVNGAQADPGVFFLDNIRKAASN